MCDAISCTTPLQIIQMISALATIAIAGIVALVAYFQWRTNQATLREKLFERRFAIFQETQSFLSMLTGKDENLDVELWRFIDTCQRSRFLYGSKIANYLDAIRIRAIEVQFQHSVMKNPEQHEDVQKHIRAYSENKLWFFSQCKLIFTEFAPYLSFELHH